MLRLRRGRFLWLSLTGGFLAMLAVLGRLPSPDRPSIVLIVADTLRADYLGLYGFRGEISPNLDRLAQQGVVFERCYSQAPWTKPAIASLLTGLHPTRHGVVTHLGYGATGTNHGGETLTTDVLDAELVTVSEALRNAGYATGAFVANAWIRADHGFAQGFDAFDRDDAGNDVPATVLVEKALAWLATLEPGEPYFLYMHLMDPHGPYDAPEDDYAAVAASPSLGADVSLSPAEFERIFDFLRTPAWTSERDGHTLRAWRGRYAAGVRAFDRRVAPLLDRVLRASDGDRTLLAITSDHGEELYEHGGWAHGTSLYGHQLHVPLLVRLPGGEHAGRRVKDVTSLVDVLPTLLGRAGIEVPATLDGKDLWPLIASEVDAPRVSYASGLVGQPRTHSIVSGNHKLIEDRATGYLQLFDLATDPGERTNLAEALPDVLAVLRQQLRDEIPDEAMPNAGRAPVSTEMRERLRALGYEAGN
jgi:arylsulfatase A-like enzyme